MKVGALKSTIQISVPVGCAVIVIIMVDMPSLFLMGIKKQIVENETATRVYLYGRGSLISYLMALVIAQLVERRTVEVFS